MNKDCTLDGAVLYVGSLVLGMHPFKMNSSQKLLLVETCIH